VARVYLVDRRLVRDAGDEEDHLRDIVEGGAGGLDGALQIGQRQLRLRGSAAGLRGSVGRMGRCAVKTTPFAMTAWEKGACSGARPVATT
jgi:hypothetical protein